MKSSATEERERLLPCPCCGSAAKVDQVPYEPETDSSGGYFIECTTCRLTTPLMFASMDDPLPSLRDAWNKRTPVSETAPGKLHELIPTTWLDPLLTGPNAVLPVTGHKYNGKDIENLLSALRERILLAESAAVTETATTESVAQSKALVNAACRGAFKTAIKICDDRMSISLDRRGQQSGHYKEAMKIRDLLAEHLNAIKD